MYPECQTVEDAYQRVKEKYPSTAHPIQGEIASIDGGILRISLFDKGIPTLKVITESVVGRRWFLFKRRSLTETTFTYDGSTNGWERQYPEKQGIELYPAEEMVGVLYDQKCAKTFKRY